MKRVAGWAKKWEVRCDESQKETRFKKDFFFYHSKELSGFVVLGISVISPGWREMGKVKSGV